MAATRRFVSYKQYRQTPVTWLLIALNVVLYLVVSLQGGEFLNTAVASPLLNKMVLIPFSLYFGHYWRLITSGFMHLGLVHIVFNMWALYILGRDIETVIGTRRFTLLYVVSLMAGSASVVWFSPMMTATAGASGAIFGLLGAEFIVLLRLHAKLRNVIVVILLNIFIGLTLPNVSLSAHLGGFAAGLLMSVAFIYGPRLCVFVRKKVPTQDHSNPQEHERMRNSGNCADIMGWVAAGIVTVAVGVCLWSGVDHVVEHVQQNIGTEDSLSVVA